MRFAVQHDTLYRYSVPVVLAPHVLRLTPRPESRIRTRSLQIWPAPADQRQVLDGHGNAITSVSFWDRPTDQLRIESRLELDTVVRAPPPPPTGGPLPWTGAGADGLAPYRASTSLGSDPTVAAFARDLAVESGGEPLAFLDHLCRTIHGRADNRRRATGDAQGAAQTLLTWRGACRDVTALFLAAARSQGMPARFCSGYHALPDAPGGRADLHAWPEVFLAGAGWLGWDPTQGTRTGDGHVALCAGPDQADTMPVTGGYSFGGFSILVTLDFDLRIATS